MLVTPESNRRNFCLASVAAAISIAFLGALAVSYPLAWLTMPLAWLPFAMIRYRTARRLRVVSQPFPEEWERTLQGKVEFFRALSSEDQQRFRKRVQLFLDETPITGVRTDVDEEIRALVAASAVIPTFGFDDWEYRGLGEILIYPTAFGDDYRTDEEADRNTLGMIGINHLSGVMILSKPALIHWLHQQHRQAKRRRARIRPPGG